MSRAICPIHGTPMNETASDVLAENCKITVECGACQKVAFANRTRARADAALERGDEEKAKQLDEVAKKIDADVVRLSGRWFECRREGQEYLTDLSEAMIEEFCAKGETIDVMKKIV